MAADTRALLAREHHRFAGDPFIGVSARLAAEAAARAVSDPSLAAELAEESGIGRLSSVLVDLAGRAPDAASANRVQRARARLVTAHRRLGQQVLAAQGSAALEEALAGEERRLDDLRRESTSWGPQLSRSISRLRIDVIGSLSSERTAAVRRLQERFKTCPKVDLEQATDLAQAEAEAMHRATLQRLAGGLGEIATGLLGDLATSEARLRELLDGTAGSASTYEPSSSPDGSSPAAGLDVMTGVTVAFGGTMMATNLPGLLGLAAIMPVTAVAAPVLGVAWAAGVVRKKKGLAARAEVVRWVREALAEAREKTQTEVERSIVEGQYQLASAVRDQIERRQVEVTRARQECAAAIRQDEQTRKRRVAQLKARQSHLAGLGQRAEALLVMADQRLGLPAGDYA